MLEHEPVAGRDNDAGGEGRAQLLSVDARAEQEVDGRLERRSRDRQDGTIVGVESAETRRQAQRERSAWRLGRGQLEREHRVAAGVTGDRFQPRTWQGTTEPA